MRASKTTDSSKSSNACAENRPEGRSAEPGEVQLLADRYERRSTVLTTNLAFSEWVQVFGDEKLTTALLDRLGHHGHILTTRGDSFRTRKRRTTTTN